MLISVITPVLNGSATIERTLRSVSVQKGDFEHIVLDGGSNDNTPEIVESFKGTYPVQLVRKRDRSLYEGVWNGMQEARGECLCYLNADDIYHPWTLATVRETLAMHSEVQWLTGIPSWYYESSGVGVTCSFAPIYFKYFIKNGWYSSKRLGFLQQESMFWRRSLWERADAKDILLKYRLGGDFHLWKRFAQHSSLYTAASVLASFVISEKQASRTGLATYLSECGIEGSASSPPLLWRLFHRLLSSAYSGKVLQPPTRF